MRRIKLILEYDGTGYHGWQRQPEGLTLQGLIEDAVFRATGEKTDILSAGRTDAGVHALGQVAAFSTDSSLSSEVLKRALNALLPDDVRVLDIHDMPESFHPRYDALRKQYFYLISTKRASTVFSRRYMWQVNMPLNVDDMRSASAYIAGRHDFSCFRGSGCGARNTVREIYSLNIEEYPGMGFFSMKLEGRLIKVSIQADAFLRHMVRNIVGTLVEVGSGKMAAGHVENILDMKDRRLAGPTAPARGLFLEKVDY